MKRAAAALALAASVTGAADAAATLGSDVEALAARYRAEGADVRVLPVRFLGPGATLPIQVAEGAEECVTVAVLGAPSTVFVLKAPRGSSPPEIVPSTAGTAGVVLCGSARTRTSSVNVEMRSPHGIVETLVALSATPLTPPRAVLAHRDPGPLPRIERPGPAAAPAPLAARADALIDRYLREGSAEVDRRFVPADSRGAGRLLLGLEPGCHRLAVLGVASGNPDSFRDVDAELAWASGEIADTDRAESPDAVLEACTGERSLSMLSFAGASPDVPILLLHATVPLAPGVPEVFGPEGRARVTGALLARHAPQAKGPPIEAWLGAQGGTRVPFEPTPGQCYLVALVAIRGGAKLLTLETPLGTGSVRGHTAEATGGTAVITCARLERRTHFDVQAHGAGLVWGLAVWPFASIRLGEEQP